MNSGIFTTSCIRMLLAIIDEQADEIKELKLKEADQ